MSPTGQISPAIRFDRVFLFALVLFSKDPFEPMCLFGCEPFIPERKIVTYHAGDSKSRIENRRRRASLLGQFFIRLAASSTVVTVRREKALDFSGCNSRPGTGSLHPVAIEAAAVATKRSELSMGVSLGDRKSQITHREHCCLQLSGRRERKY
jgi:hypothetical protein